MKRVALVLFLALCGLQPLAAGSIDVTGAPEAVLTPNRQLDFEFGIWNYGSNNPGSSPYPTSLEFQLVGLLSTSMNIHELPGSTAGYIHGYLLEGWLESLDGTMRVPLIDPLAWQAGYGSGFLLLSPGSACGSAGCPVAAAVATAAVSLTSSESEALFGDNAGNYQNAARIHLVNLGKPLVIGLGPDYPVWQSVSVTHLSGDGPVETGAIPGKITIHNPEPSTLLLLLSALPVLWWVRRHKQRTG